MKGSSIIKRTFLNIKPMKHISIIIIILIYLSVFQTKAQNKENLFTADYKVTYRLEYSPDSTYIDKKSTEDFYLFVGDDKSKFISKNKWIRDSISSKRLENFNGSHLEMPKKNSPKTNFLEVIFKDYNDNQISTVDRVASDVFLYSEVIKPYTWEIKKDKKTMNEFEVQKAITSFAGRNYVAWFTEEISIPQGPYKFEGLPGLIIQISDTNHHYNYKLISFQKTGGKEIKAINRGRNYVKASKKQFYQAKQDFYDNPIPQIPFDLTPKDKQRIKEKYKKRNNPIELE